MLRQVVCERLANPPLLPLGNLHLFSLRSDIFPANLRRNEDCHAAVLDTLSSKIIYLNLIAKRHPIGKSINRSILTM